MESLLAEVERLLLFRIISEIELLYTSTCKQLQIVTYIKTIYDVAYHFYNAIECNVESHFHCGQGVVHRSHVKVDLP